MIDNEQQRQQQYEREQEHELQLLRREEDLHRALLGSKALAKAVQDPFDYAMKLRTGEVITFESAEVIDREWVHLVLKPMEQQPKSNTIAFPAMRGVDVRISDIVWVMDAPMGS